MDPTSSKTRYREAPSNGCEAEWLLDCEAEWLLDYYLNHKQKRPTQMTNELSQKEKKVILQISIERVINNTMRYLDLDNDSEGVNYEDWEECKPIVMKLWAGARKKIQEEKAE